MTENMLAAFAYATKEILDEVNEDNWVPQNPVPLPADFNEVCQEFLEEELHEEQKIIELGIIPYQYFPMVTMIEAAPEMMLITQHVYQDSNGFLCNKENEILFNASIQIVCIYENEKDTSEVEFRLELQDGEVKEYRMKVELFREGGWYKSVFGIECKDSRALREYLEHLCGNASAKKVKSFPVAGWYQKSGRFNYYTKSGDVLGESSKVDIKNEGIEIYPVKNKSEQELARAFFDMRFLTNDATAEMLLSYLILAVNYSLFRDAGYTPKGIMAVIGPRSSRKTSLVMVMMKLFRRQEGMTPYYNFHSTKTSIDEGLHMFKDGILIVDDLMPSEDTRQKNEIESTLEYITRVFGDAISKKRSRNYTGNVEYKPEGLAVITGEYIAGVSSSMSRRIVLKIAQDTVNCENLTFYQENLEILPGFLWNFLRYCAINQEQILSEIKSYMKACRRQHQDTYNISRYAEYYAELETAMLLLLDYFESLQMIDSIQKKEMLISFSVVVHSVLSENEEDQAEKEPIEQVRLTISEYFYNNQEFFVDIDSSDNTARKGMNYYDREFLYIHPEWLLEKVKEFTARQGILSAIQDVSYLKTILINADALEVIKEGSDTRKAVKIRGAKKRNDSRRFLKIKRSKILIAP